MLVDPEAPQDHSAVAGRLLDLAIGHRDERAVRVLAEAAEQGGGTDSANVLAGMLLLITSMPEYQLC